MFSFSKRSSFILSLMLVAFIGSLVLLLCYLFDFPDGYDNSPFSAAKTDRMTNLEMVPGFKPLSVTSRTLSIGRWWFISLFFNTFWDRSLFCDVDRLVRFCSVARE